MYYLDLAVRSLRRTPVLTALMITAIAVGIGATMTMVSLLHGVLENPAGGRSGTLFHVQIDPRPADVVAGNPTPPDGLTYQDTVNLLPLTAPYPRAFTAANWMPLRREDAPQLPQAMVTVRATTAGFLSLFHVPFQDGSGWSEADDHSRARVVVISQALNQQIFGGGNSVGRTLIISTQPFRVIGVLADWNPHPRFYDVDSGAFDEAEGVYLPFFTWLNLPQDYGYGTMSCWGRDAGAGEHNPRTSECGWVQMWVGLPDAAAVSAFRARLSAYSSEQRASGRFQVAPDVRLLSVAEWLRAKNLLPAVIQLQTWIAAGIFLVCMLNTVGLLFVKFLSQERDTGVRRALGASRRAMLIQHLAEAAVIGVWGGMAGALLAFGGVTLIHQRAAAIFKAAEFDTAMLMTTILAAIAATVAAATWPAWHASFVTPAQQLRST
jgi:putative ABC transport system permease protein